MKNIWAMTAGIAGLLFLTAAGDVPGWDCNLVVEKDHPVLLGADYKDLVATNLVAHDNLTIGVGGTFNVYPIDAEGYVTSDWLARIALGPNSGEMAVLEVNKSSVLQTESNGYNKGCKKIGAAMRGALFFR